MACTWSAPEPFPSLCLGAPFAAMQPAPPAGLQPTLFDLEEPTSALTAAFAALQGGTPPAEVLADFALALGDHVALLSGPPPSGPGSETKAIGPVFQSGDFDDKTTGRPAMADALRNAAAPRSDISGALGCVDVSIAFVNQRFRRVDPMGGPDTTRFEMLWLQGRSMATPPAYGTLLRAGTLLLRQDIDALIARHWNNGGLDERAAYAEFSTTPEGVRDLWRLGGGHGTAVLDLIAGEDAGAAPDDRPIYGVELPVAVVRDTSGSQFHGPLTYGLGLIALASYVLSRTSSGDAAPFVMNASMSFLGGPHDGNHPTAKTLAEIASLAEGPGGATPRPAKLTLPAGNHLQAGIHGRAIPDNATVLRWSVPPEDRTASFVEIWNSVDGDPPDLGGLTLCPPGQTGGNLGSLPAPGERVHLAADGQRVAQLHNLGTHLLLGLYPTTTWQSDPMSPSGLWHLVLTGSSTTPHLIWVARDDTLSGLPEAGRQSWFRDPGYDIFDGMGDLLRHSAMSAEGLRRDGTLSVIATGGPAVSVVVGSEDRGRKAYRFAGLTLNQASHPVPTPGTFEPAAEISRALGGPKAATRLGGGVLRASGTSMASAIAARQIMQDMTGGSDANPFGNRETDTYRY